MMRTKIRPQFIVIVLGSFILLALFQNMTLVDFTALGISEVDETVRQGQARELLGTHYKKSSAQKLEGQPYLNYLIYKKVESALGPKWKDRIPELVQTIITESQSLAIDPIFVLAVIQTESSFNPRAKGGVGEIGLMQLRPDTAEWIAKKYAMEWTGPDSLYDPVVNVKIGITYFAHLRIQFPQTAYHYLPAYNMGPGNVRKIDKLDGSIKADGRVQKREYAVRVMKNYDTIYLQMASEQIEIDRLAKSEEYTNPTR